MSKRYVESPLAPHEQARAVENEAAHAVGERTKKAHAHLRSVNAGWLIRRDERGAVSRNRAVGGAGAKQNPRRNGRLMATLTERHALSGLPTAPVESVERALVRWRDPTFTDGVKVSGSRKGKSRDGKVYRKP